MGSMSVFDVQVLSSSQVYPESLSLTNTSPIPLSIVDNICTDYARCAAVWFYGPSCSSAFAPDHLRHALSKTLNYYSQWCRKLAYSTDHDGNLHIERYQRLWVGHKSSEDNGVLFTVASSPKRLVDFLPETKLRTASMKAWDASKLPTSELLQSTQLAPCANEDAPNVMIQSTTFACGSTAFAIQISHCLADAVSLCQFAKDLSITSRALLSGLPAPVLSPVFDPHLLDSCAAGDIDVSVPDIEIQKEARKLPQHRYDWYKTTADQPREPNIPADLDRSITLSPSDPIPWKQWNWKDTISHRVLHFSKLEIERIYDRAKWSSGTDPAPTITKHDALLAHIWLRITSTRNLAPGTPSWLDMTFGLRTRVRPALPDTYLGSPITHAAIPYPASGAASLSSLADTIHSTLAIFTPAAIANFLHDRAFEYAPQRLWSCCLGKQHVLLTTWVHAGQYDVVFEEESEGKGSRRPLYVEAVMPPGCDGLVEVMEAPGVKGKSWIENGVDVDVYLEEEAMGRLVSDELLWEQE